MRGDGRLPYRGPRGPNLSRVYANRGESNDVARHTNRSCVFFFQKNS